MITAILMAVVLGQPAAEPKPATPPPPPAAAPTSPAPGTQPTLDELLGIKPDKPQTPTGIDSSRAELDRRLKEENPADGFAEAVTLMDDAARRLGGAVADTTVQTQRIQEDAIRKIDALIAQARRQRQQQQQQQQQQSQPQQDQGQQQQPSQPQQGNERQQGATNPENATNTPGRRDGALRPGLDSARAAWGSLPARLRDMLMQGSGEKFSTPYERLTEEYYRRLAERKD